MHSILRYSTSLSEAWVAWVMLFMIALLLLANSSQKGFILNSFRGITTAKERESIFSEGAMTTSSVILVVIYEIGIVAMCLYAVLFKEGEEHFGIINYLIIMGLVCGYIAIKNILMYLVSYIFLNKKDLSAIRMHYSNLYLVVCTILYPIVLVILFAPFMNNIATYTILGILLFFTLVIWLIKAFRLFFNSLVAGFYIFLYLCTLEIIPIVGIILVIKNFVL